MKFDLFCEYLEIISKFTRVVDFVGCSNLNDCSCFPRLNVTDFTKILNKALSRIVRFPQNPSSCGTYS